MNLTRNFSLSELTKSDTAIRKGIDNNPNPEQIDKLKTLCEKYYSRYVITSVELQLPRAIVARSCA